MYVMGKEPLPNMTAEDLKQFFADKQSEKDLADAFAMASNKFWWVEDDEYDYDVGTPEHVKAQSITDAWRKLMGEYEHRILSILQGEGIAVPETGRIDVLILFMKRYGYIDGNGWWVKEK